MLDPYFSAPKMRWLRENVTTAGVVTTTRHLAGAPAVRRVRHRRLHRQPLAADRPGRRGLERRAARRCSAWPRSRCPAIVPSDEIVGTTRVFGGELPVAGLIVDQQAALLAEACLQAGDAKCTFGTGAFLLACTGTTPVRSTAGLTTSVAWRLRGQTSYCMDGQVYTAASAVRWITQLGLIAGADQLDAAAAPSSDGVLCVPALAGLAAPWWDSAATASFSGMTLSSGRGHLVRALLEGIAAQVAELAGLVAADLGGPLTRLRVDGGLTRSRVLMQAQADLAQIPVEVYPSAHATPLGAAACARLALDPAAGLADVIGGWNPEHTYEPAWSADRAAELPRPLAAGRRATRSKGTATS